MIIQNLDLAWDQVMRGGGPIAWEKHPSEIVPVEEIIPIQDSESGTSGSRTRTGRENWREELDSPEQPKEPKEEK